MNKQRIFRYIFRLKLMATLLLWFPLNDLSLYILPYWESAAAAAAAWLLAALAA